MGCVSVLPWLRLEEGPFDTTVSHSTEPFPQGTAFFALETGGTRLEEFPFPTRGIMIIGSEELGVSPSALARADASLGRVSIPVFGAKGSLNASVAFGIAMHAWAGALFAQTKPPQYE
jgi:TrmH family RNA methyltransferase